MYRSAFIVIALFGTTLLANAQNRIEIEIENFESDKGVALIGLYNTETSFLKTEYKGQKADIKNKKVSLSFTGIPDGAYAVSIFHDEDGNGELTTNFIGIPKEAYGSSNNAPSNFGPPTWKDAKFEVKDGQVVKQKITL